MKKKIIILVLLLIISFTINAAGTLKIIFRNRTSASISDFQLGQNGYDAYRDVPVLLKGSSRRMKIPKKAITDSIYLKFLKNGENHEDIILEKEDIGRIKMIIISIFDTDDGDYFFILSQG